jgi:hypothetical protein
MTSDETLLWHLGEGLDQLSCVMISCCAGAELQVRRGIDVVRRELYPDKSTLYERAEQLKREAASAHARSG